MRIVAGKYRNRRLLAGGSMRPTAGSVREAMFNMLVHGVLAFKIESARVMDLFCGSGALGIEALSRGAKQLVAIDMETSWVYQNTRLVSEECLIIKSDLSKNLPLMCGLSLQGFNVIFIDPPYSNPELIITVLKQMLNQSHKFLQDGTIIVIEMSHHTQIEALLITLCESCANATKYRLIKERIYNRVKVVFLEFR